MDNSDLGGSTSKDSDYATMDFSSRSAVQSDETDGQLSATTKEDSTSPEPTNPTLYKNQMAIKRNPSKTATQSPLARAISTKSTKSNASYDAGLSRSATLGFNTFGADTDSQSLSGNESLGSITESGDGSGVKKSDSVSTNRSTKSQKSDKSVQSLAAIGAYPIGSLRVHEPDTALSDSPECLATGDVILITNARPGMFFGCDISSFMIGKDGHFQGIRDVPPGAHFIYAGSGDNSARNGFWLISQSKSSAGRGEIHVKRWAQDTESLEEEVGKAETRIQKDRVPAIFNSLMPYTNNAKPTTSNTGGNVGVKDPELWPRLTSCIKGAMLTRITSFGWNEWRVASTDDYKPTEFRAPATDAQAKLNQQMDEANDNADRLKHLDSKDRVLDFAFPQNSTTFSSDVTGRQRTEQALDTSAHVWKVISDRCTHMDEDEVAGELQFSFLTGMLLGNMACMEQWGWVIKVIFKAFRFSMDHPVLFRKIIDTFHAQLIFNEQGLDSSIFEHDPSLEDDLKMILTTFKSRLNEELLARGSELSLEQEAVGKAFEALETYLWKMEWDLRGNYLRSGKIQLEDGEYVDAELKDFEAEDERGEYAPVIVDLNEDGTEHGLLRWGN